MSKFSNDLANGMDSILKDSKFQRIFSKTASVKVASEEIFDIQGLADQYPDAYNALLMPDKIKFRDYQFHVNSAGKICAKDPVGTDEFIFLHSPDRAPTWMKTAESAENAFNSFASKKKKDDEEEDDKEEKSDKKKDKKDDKDSDKEEKSDKKKKDKDSDKDEDKDDKKSKKSKKDDDDEDDKDDKKKDKKKSFPFFKKKKAGEACKEGCDCEDCAHVNDSNDEKYANAIRHIVESFTVTSDVLDNMGLEKSAVATMAILNHIIEEAATVKFAKESEEHVLKEKIKHLVDKFDKMTKSENGYDEKIAEALDEKITKLEEELKDLKKKDLKTDENDVRGTDLLLGLEDEEAHEGYNDPEMDDPKSSAVLEDIFSKNPKLVDDIAPRLKSQFGDKDIEEQLKSRIQSRLPEVVTTPEDTNIDAILNAYQEARNIPADAKLPGDFEKGPKYDPLKTEIDQLNAIDRDMDDDQLVKKMVNKLQHHFEDYDDYGEVNCTKLSEDIADEFDLYEGEDGKIPERVFEAAVEAAEAYESLKENDEQSEELNFADDGFGFDVLENYPVFEEEYESLPIFLKNQSGIKFFENKVIVFWDKNFKVKFNPSLVCIDNLNRGYGYNKENHKWIEIAPALNKSNDITRAYTLINEWTKTAHEFEDDSDNKINVGDIESILDVLGNYSQDEIAEKEKSFKHPENLDELTNEFYDAAMEREAK